MQIELEWRAMMTDHGFPEGLPRQPDVACDVADWLGRIADGALPRPSPNPERLPSYVLESCVLLNRTIAGRCGENAAELAEVVVDHLRRAEPADEDRLESGHDLVLSLLSGDMASTYAIARATAEDAISVAAFGEIVGGIVRLVDGDGSRVRTLRPERCQCAKRAPEIASSTPSFDWQSRSS